jgi:hypothetical protein
VNSNAVYCSIIFANRIESKFRSSGRNVTQLKKYHFSGEAIELLFFFQIQLFKIEESKTANTYAGKKGML